ncbi:MAG: hypothetical protein U0525_00010 [Patescibacteria group bacterium]
MRRYFSLFLLILLTALYLIGPVTKAFAQDLQCGEFDVDGLETMCVSTALEKDDGKPTSYALSGQYYKCIDTVPGCKENERCCVRPLQGQYGGQCFDPDVSRNKLGVGDRQGFFDFLQPQNCDKVPDAEVEGNKDVLIENDLGAFDRQLKESAFKNDVDANKLIVKGKSEGGIVFKTVYESNICGGTFFAKFNCSIQKKEWFYEVRKDGKRAFMWEPTNYNGEISLNYEGIPDPRPGTGIPEKSGCWFGNAFKTPFFNAVSSLSKTFTNADNFPDITLLCNKGTPIFTKSNAIEYKDDKVVIKDPSACYCSDGTSGPATSAVLLCTRFVMGVGDNSPWRAILPDQFKNLLLGGIIKTTNISEIRAGVKKEVDKFFFDENALKKWLLQVDDQSEDVSFPNPTALRSRVFGEKYKNTQKDLNAENRDVQKDINLIIKQTRTNPYTREFVSCLACAQYGGFQSALGCMPMDKAERFISEGILGIGISIAGAVTILCMIYGAMLYQLSMGESSQVQKAQKLITGCFFGLITIIFALFILKVIGVDLLRIPGLG